MILAVFMAMCCGLAAEEEAALSERPMNAVERGAKLATEQLLTRVLGARAQIESVRVDADNQTLEVRGLRLANPRGFSEGDALTAGLVRLKADPRVLFSDAPTVQLAALEGLIVNAETTLTQGSNLKRLLDNVKELQEKKAAKMLGKGGAALQPKQKLWRIEKATLGEAVINMRTRLLQEDKRQIKFGPWETSFKGANDEGVPAEKILEQVMERLLKEIDIVPEDSPVRGLLDVVSEL